MKKLLIITLVIIILTPLCTIEIQKYLYEKRVTAYLTDNKFYQKDEIQSVKAKWHFAGLPSYWVNVVFSNEPNIVYIYYAHNTDAVGQYEYYAIDGSDVSTERLKYLEN